MSPLGLKPVSVEVVRPLGFSTLGPINERERVVVPPGKYPVQRTESRDGSNGLPWVRLLEKVCGVEVGMPEACLVAYAEDGRGKRRKTQDHQGPMVEITWEA